MHNEVTMAVAPHRGDLHDSNHIGVSMLGETW